MTKLSRNGYIIKKSDYTLKEIKDIKTDLTVKPFVNGDYGAPPKAFPIYCESVRKLYLPRFYAQDKLGLAKKVKMNSGYDVDIPFNGKLREEQIPIVDLYFAQNGKRYRSLGDKDITKPVESNASTLDQIIKELQNTKTSERSGRLMDKEEENIFEKLRSKGYM